MPAGTYNFTIEEGADFALGLRVRIGLDATVTDELQAQNARWDLLATLPDGRRMRLLEGKVTISGSVTEL
jgi:hypothetical protein